MALYLCSVCGDEFDDALGGGQWNGDWVCAGCERRTLGPAIDAMTAITHVLEEAGLADAEMVANEVYTAIVRSGCIIVGLNELAERNAAFRLEIEDLRAELGR